MGIDARVTVKEEGVRGIRGTDDSETATRFACDEEKGKSGRKKRTHRVSDAGGKKLAERYETRTNLELVNGR